MRSYLSKFFYILSLSKKKFFFLVILLILVSTLEALGIGLVGPFLKLAGKPEILYQYPSLSKIYDYLELSSEQEFIALIGLIIISVFIVKSLLTWLIKVYVFKISYKERAKLSARLIKLYLKAPYVFTLQKSSAYATQIIHQDTQAFAMNIFMTILNNIANIAIAFSLIILLCLTDVLAVLVVLAIILPLILFFYSLKDKIKQYGKTLVNTNEESIRVINHSTGGLKEIKVIGCQPYFENQLAQQVNKFANAGTSLMAIKLIPRFLAETVIMVSLIGYTSICLLLGVQLEELTASLGIFALASLRLMPAITNLANGINTLKSSSYRLDKIYFTIRELEQENSDQKYLIDYQIKDCINQKETIYNPHKLVFSKQISVESVSFKYPGCMDNALDNISFLIEKNKSIALIGKSGAGKTTLVDVVLGLLIPQAGDIKVDNQSIYDDLRSWQNAIGYIPQSIFLSEDTVKRNIAFGVPDNLVDQKRLKEVIEAAQLEEVIQELPSGVETIVGERGIRLSGGQRQRIGIARALYHEREILVLDEATSALDQETENLVTKAIHSLSGKKTIIIIAHRLTTVENCNHIYLIDKGQIIKSGSYQEVVFSEQLSLN